MLQLWKFKADPKKFVIKSGFFWSYNRVGATKEQDRYQAVFHCFAVEGFYCLHRVIVRFQSDQRY